ncbi:MAG: DUF61 family protein [Candidatus Thorarchaeota archaeon]|nr:DUF61 family protein [Candidatus Thorarchaeota archaeon]
MSGFIDKMIEHDIDTLNDHLPESRVPLSDLIGLDSPQFKTRIGEVSVFRIEEIEEISLEVPERFHRDIRLPIVFLRRLDYGPGIYTIAGSKAELFMLHRIIGYVDLGWEDFATWKSVEKLARPQVQLLRRKLPSTTSIGIGMSSKETPGFNAGQ